MTATPRVGILGGTLDPVHVGHLEAAAAARGALALDLVLLIPSRVPPHRTTQPSASPFHRFAMAALAVNGRDDMAASDIELSVPGPSFTADTLTRLHGAGLGPSQIFFITGADAFAEIETWSRYPDVLDLSHFIVVSRPGQPASDLEARVPALARRMLTGTREAATASKPTIFLVDAATPDVSSTDIRRRIRAGEAVRGLVPERVEQHIRQHGLYGQPHAAAALQSAADHLHGQD
jgi:nicotinate-nucleotide adenylyltransferase